MFKKAFLDSLFPREKREAKVVEFVNLYQGCTSVLEYSLKFTELTKYALSLVSEPRDKMNHFVTGVSDDLREECHLSMLQDNMNISLLIVHAQQVEETRAKRKSRDAKRARSFDDGSSKGSLEIHDSQGSRKGFLIMFLPNFLRLGMIGCLTLSLRKVEILVHLTRIVLVPNVGRVILVNVQWEHAIALVVTRMATRLGIALI